MLDSTSAAGQKLLGSGFVTLFMSGGILRGKEACKFPIDLECLHFNQKASVNSGMIRIIVVPAIDYRAATASKVSLCYVFSNNVVAALMRPVVTFVVTIQQIG